MLVSKGNSASSVGKVPAAKLKGANETSSLLVELHTSPASQVGKMPEVLQTKSANMVVLGQSPRA